MNQVKNVRPESAGWLDDGAVVCPNDHDLAPDAMHREIRRRPDIRHNPRRPA